MGYWQTSQFFYLGVYCGHTLTPCWGNICHKITHLPLPVLVCTGKNLGDSWKKAVMQSGSEGAITAGWKQGDTGILIFLITQNIQPRRPWLVMGLKETEFYNNSGFIFVFNLTMITPLLFVLSFSPKDRYLLTGIWMIDMFTLVFHTVATSGSCWPHSSWFHFPFPGCVAELCKVKAGRKWARWKEPHIWHCLRNWNQHWGRVIWLSTLAKLDWQQTWQYPSSPISHCFHLESIRVTSEQCPFHRHPWLVVTVWRVLLLWLREEVRYTLYASAVFPSTSPSSFCYFFCRGWRKRLLKCLQRLSAFKMQRRGNRQTIILGSRPGKWDKMGISLFTKSLSWSWENKSTDGIWITTRTWKIGQEYPRLLWDLFLFLDRNSCSGRHLSLRYLSYLVR